MSEKRRDNKGRILRDGELQRKDGKYEYRYTDSKGGRHSVYSWRLVETDKTPTGKKAQLPLREIEKNIQKDLHDGIDFSRADKITLNEYYDEFIALKKNLKPTTLETYKRSYDLHVRDGLGKKKLSSIKYTDIKKLYLSFLDGNSEGHGIVTSVHTVLSQVYKAAIRDEIVRNNHPSSAYTEISQCLKSRAKKRHALTLAEQESFLNFIRKTPRYNRWNPLFTTLVGTGMRFGEAAGLTWDDVDFKENVIYVRRNLQRTYYDESKIFMSTPKSKAGERIIPMFNEVKTVLAEEKMRQIQEGLNNVEVDGHVGLVFIGKKGKPLLNNGVNHMLLTIVKLHNKMVKDVVLPEFSVHVLRHTFCTRMCENEVNVKILQEIMGHSDITMTMNVYAEATKDKKREVFKELEGKIAM